MGCISYFHKNFKDLPLCMLAYFLFSNEITLFDVVVYYNYNMTTRSLL